MTSTRLWHPAVLVKTRDWVECSVSRGRKTWSLSFLFKDFPRCDVGFAQLFMPTRKSIKYSVNSNELGLEQVVHTYRTLCRSHAGAVGREGLVNLIPVLTPKYSLPCVSVDSSPRSYLLKFSSDIRIPVHSAPISGRTGCEAALLRSARPSFAPSQKSRRNYSSCV